jgi:hypothetical protein
LAAIGFVNIRRNIMRIILLTLLSVLILSANAFAVASATDSESLTIGGGNDEDGNATQEIKIGLSPKVVAHYFTDGTSTTTAQWYAIATVHPGGNVGYGTAQDVNNIYMQWYDTGSDAEAFVENIPNEKGAPSAQDPPEDWSGMGWSLTPPTDPDA